MRSRFLLRVTVLNSRHAGSEFQRARRVDRSRACKKPIPESARDRVLLRVSYHDQSLRSALCSVLVANRTTSMAAMSNDALSAEDKSKYDAAKKELLQALTKKRNLDKQLVCVITRYEALHALIAFCSYRHS